MTNLSDIIKNGEEWTLELSPYQEWKLHNGEVEVPDWFIGWSKRVKDSHNRTQARAIIEAVIEMFEGMKLVNNPNKIIPKDIATYNLGFNFAITQIIEKLKSELEKV